MKGPYLVITDLDNTLYDWVTFYSAAFEAMLIALVKRLNVSRDRLVREFQEVHRRYGNSEQPFAVLELPSVKTAMQSLDRASRAKELDDVLHAFNSARREHLQLYPTVATTLQALQRARVPVIGFTDASLINAYYRLSMLGIAAQFRRLYVRPIDWEGHPDPDREAQLQPPPQLVREIPSEERKPDPRILLDICRQEGFAPSHALYVGDSMARDVAMAKAAGVTAVWARYGSSYDAARWDLLVQITHWTAEDVAREGELRIAAASVEPDFVIDEFSSLLGILSIAEGAPLTVKEDGTEMPGKRLGPPSR